MDALDRVGAGRVAGEPVEAVGGKQRHPAVEHAALERAAGLAHVKRLNGGATRRRSAPPHIHPTTTRSIPARSGRISIRSNPAGGRARPRSAPGPGRPRADRPRQLRRSESSASRPSIASRPVGPLTSASRGSCSRISGASAAHSSSLTYGRLATHEVEAPRLERPVGEPHPLGEPERGRGSPSRPRARRARCRWRRPPRRAARRRSRARSPRSRCRRRARVAGSSSSASSTSSSVSGRGISTRRSTSSSIRRKPLASRGCRRPARAARAAGPSPRTRAPRPRSTPASGLGDQPRAVAAGRPSSSSSASRRGVSTPAAASASTRRPERHADAAGDGGSAHARPRRSAPRAEPASPRPPSAEVNSLRSPARISSRLWAVSLIRWSVTRPWGKL